MKIAPANDKWDGEDEEEDIKDNWDDEEVKAPEPRKIENYLIKNHLATLHSST